MLKKWIVGLLFSCSTAMLAVAGTLPVDLYRSGNSSSARMDNVRPVDVVTYDNDGVVWVRGRQAGISTFSTRLGGKNVWKAAEGTDYSDDIYVINDHGNHWAWQPNEDMPFHTFVALMQQANAYFVKLN